MNEFQSYYLPFLYAMPHQIHMLEARDPFRRGVQESLNWLARHIANEGKVKVWIAW